MFSRILVCAAVSLFPVLAHAQSPSEILSRAPCSALSKNELPGVFSFQRGEKPDDDNPNYRTGLGLRYFDWDTQALQALRQRIRACGVEDPNGDIRAILEYNFNRRLETIRQEKTKYESRVALASEINQAIARLSTEDGPDAEVKVAAIKRQIERGGLLRKDRTALLNRIDDLEGSVAEAKRAADEDAEAERKVAAIEAEARAKQQEAASEEAAIERRRAAAQEAERRASEKAKSHDTRMSAQQEREARLAAALKARDEAESRAKAAKSQNETSARVESKAQDSERQLAQAEDAQKQSADALERELNTSPACRRSRDLRDNAKNMMDELAKVAIEIGAGMDSEACSRTKKLYFQAEELRSTFAECNPQLAFGPNQVVVAIREMADEHECRL